MKRKCRDVESRSPDCSMGNKKDLHIMCIKILVFVLKLFQIIGLILSKKETVLITVLYFHRKTITVLVKA